MGEALFGGGAARQGVPEAIAQRRQESIRPMNEAEKILYWGQGAFSPQGSAWDRLELADMVTPMPMGALRKMSTDVGKKELDQLFVAFKKHPAWTAADNAKVEKLMEAERGKGSWLETVEKNWDSIVDMVKKYGVYVP